MDNQQIMSLSETLLAALKLIIGHEVTAELLLNGTGTGNYSICIDVAKELIQTTAHDDLYLANERNLLQFLIVNSEADGEIQSISRFILGTCDCLWVSFAQFILCGVAKEKFTKKSFCTQRL